MRAGFIITKPLGLFKCAGPSQLYAKLCEVLRAELFSGSELTDLGTEPYQEFLTLIL